MKVSEILEKAADLIEPEGAWTQGAFARTDRGNIIGPETAGAKCFCAVGAIYRVSPSYGVANRVIDNLPKRRGYLSFAMWNDDPDRQQFEVVAALRHDAALAREQGQ